MVGRRPSTHDYCGLDVVNPLQFLPELGSSPALLEIMLTKRLIKAAQHGSVHMEDMLEERIGDQKAHVPSLPKRWFYSV